eukprot:gene6697-6920_t
MMKDDGLGQLSAVVVDAAYGGGRRQGRLSARAAADQAVASNLRCALRQMNSSTGWRYLLYQLLMFVSLNFWYLNSHLLMAALLDVNAGDAEKRTRLHYAFAG